MSDGGGQVRLGAIQALLGAGGAWFIRLWLRVFGRSVDVADAPWLAGPIGPGDGVIGDRPYALVASAEGLIAAHDPEAGLVPDFSALDGPSFRAADTDDEVRRFYEHTAAYGLEVWSHAPFPGRLPLWAIVSTVSRAMNQLNFPVTAMELARGMTSEVIPLRDAGGSTVYTGWLRRVAGVRGRVVYTGFYASKKPPGHPSPCVKVVFPLPHGNATVILKPSIEEGRFRLRSSGERFGDPGFYRVLQVAPGRLKVLYLRSLKERFAVYRDDAGVLRCDHEVDFLGLPILRLHYKMTRAAGPGGA